MVPSRLPTAILLNSFKAWRNVVFTTCATGRLTLRSIGSYSVSFLIGMRLEGEPSRFAGRSR